MELNQKLDSKKLNKLKSVTMDAPVYCIPVDLTKSGSFTTDSFVGATQSGIFVFEDDDFNYYPFDKIQKVFNRVQTNGSLFTVLTDDEEIILARSSMRFASGIASLARGVNILLSGNTERRVINNEREKRCRKCGRVLPGTVDCPKCDKSGGN